MKVKQTAKQVAKTLAREPIEILKTAVKQVGGEAVANPAGGQISSSEKPKPQESPEAQAKKKAQDRRFLEALQNETQELIVREKQKEAQAKQQEAVLVQEEKQKSKFERSPQVQSKPPRGLSFFKKRLGKNVEQRKPPSG